MINDISLHAFEEIVNPIILCETNGKVIFKNREAVKAFPKPIRGGNVTTYLSKESLKDFREGMHFPAFLDLTVEGDFFCAFADTVYYERRQVLLLVFSHVFLYQPSIPLYRASCAKLKELTSGEKIANLITALYTSDSMLKAARDRSYHQKMTRIFYKIVSAILTELAFGRDTVNYPINYVLDILNYACDKVLSHLGLDILFQNNYADGDMLTVDFKPFTLFAANFILFAAEISQGHIIYAEALQDSENDALRMIFKVAAGNLFSAVPLGSTAAFAELLPGRSLDLYFFGLACKESGYRFDFTLNPTKEYNLFMRLCAPVYRPLILRDKALFSREDAYRIIDGMLADLLQEE